MCDIPNVVLLGFCVYNQIVQRNALTVPKLKFAHTCINSYMLCRSNFSYMFRPADVILGENFETKECTRESQMKRAKVR